MDKDNDEPAVSDLSSHYAITNKKSSNMNSIITKQSNAYNTAAKCQQFEMSTCATQKGGNLFSPRSQGPNIGQSF